MRVLDESEPCGVLVRTGDDPVCKDVVSRGRDGEVTFSCPTERGHVRKRNETSRGLLQVHNQTVKLPRSLCLRSIFGDRDPWVKSSLLPPFGVGSVPVTNPTLPRLTLLRHTPVLTPLNTHVSPRSERPSILLSVFRVSEVWWKIRDVSGRGRVTGDLESHDDTKMVETDGHCRGGDEEVPRKSIS